MKRLIAIAITIAVFAAMILPTATVMGSTLDFHEVFSDPEDIFGAQGEVWGNYEIWSGYLSASIYVEPTSNFHYVYVKLYVDLDGDCNPDFDEPYFEATNYEEIRGSDEWFEPLELTYSGYVPPWAEGASVYYIVQTNSVWFTEIYQGWGTEWHIPPEGVIENFEFGHHGSSLDQGYGDVDWTVTKMGWWGNPVAEFDASVEHTGTKSARFYRPSYSWAIASYLQTRPESRKFYLYFEEGSTAILNTLTGDEGHGIYVRVRRGEGGIWLLEYYDVSWHEYEMYYPPGLQNRWYSLEFRNIDWDSETYDIRFDSAFCVLGAHMGELSTSVYNGKTVYYNFGGLGSECWIDDIMC